MRRSDLVLVAVSLAAAALPSQAEEQLGLGHPVSDAQIRAWDIDVRADGHGLPAGRGTVLEGERIYQQKCLACHGSEGAGKPMDRLAGAQGTLASAAPIKTIGSYWPYATTLFDYINRAMPFTSPQSLRPDEVYALTAYLLHLNGIVPADATLDASALPKVRMPNRDGFVPDARPDVVNKPCLSSCRP